MWLLYGNADTSQSNNHSSRYRRYVWREIWNLQKNHLWICFDALTMYVYWYCWKYKAKIVSGACFRFAGQRGVWSRYSPIDCSYRRLFNVRSRERRRSESSTVRRVAQPARFSLSHQSKFRLVVVVVVIVVLRETYWTWWGQLAQERVDK